MYKVRHRVFATKDFLFKIGKSDDSLCAFCKTEPETHEHVFIYCVQTIDAWIFVENLLRRISGSKHYYLNDSMRILGHKLNYVESVVIAKMIRQIWNVRCKIVFDNFSSQADIDLIMNFKQNLKSFLCLEHKRLPSESFKLLYCKNNVLCSVDRSNELTFVY